MLSGVLPHCLSATAESCIAIYQAHIVASGPSFLFPFALGAFAFLLLFFCLPSLQHQMSPSIAQAVSIFQSNQKRNRPSISQPFQCRATTAQWFVWLLFSFSPAFASSYIHITLSLSIYVSFLVFILVIFMATQFATLLSSY